MLVKGIPKGSVSRRQFVRDLARWGAAAGTIPMLDILTGERMGLFAQDAGKPVVVDEKYYGKLRRVPADLHPTDQKYYEAVEDNGVRCHICARHCFLPEGKTGFCRTHVNRGGKLYVTNFNRACILQKDPIESGPFYHVHPGAMAMSVAAPGCMLRCLYCREWRFSQSLPGDVPCMNLNAWDVVKSTGGYPAEGPAINTIMFTYTEPVAFQEYMMAIAEEARKHGVHCVCASSGYWGPVALKDAIEVNDAFCITLKGATEQFYVNVLGAHLQPVLDNLVTIRQSGKWLEVVVLLVPGYNDDTGLLKEQAKWWPTTWAKTRLCITCASIRRGDWRTCRARRRRPSRTRAI